MHPGDAVVDEVAHLLGCPVDADVLCVLVVFCACKRAVDVYGKR